MLARVLAATLAGGVVFFFLGFVIYGLILDGMVMKPNMNTFPGLMNETPVWLPLILSNFVSAFLLAYIFEKWATISTFMGGMKAGATIMFLVSLSFQLMFVAFMNISKNYIPPVADVLGSTVLGAVSGGVIGAVLGMMKKES